MERENKEVTKYRYESYDWVEHRISQLLKEVEMLTDLKEKFLELERLKHPDPTKAGEKSND